MKQPGPSAFRSNIMIAFLSLPNTRRQQGSNAYAALGDDRKAIDYYEQRLVIAREIGDRRGEGNSSWNLGLTYEKTGDLKRAAEMMQICVSFEQEIGHPDAVKHAERLEAIRAKLKRRS
ncbi:MAG: tetratricopeptide repeat protein [Methanothrix sp.]|nr:tetratricopeptide repeat protein [Methanothrix sp.]